MSNVVPLKKKTKVKGTGGALKLYKSYSFVSKDPVIDKIRTIINKEGVSYRDIVTDSGVSYTTLHNWFDGQTRRPQYATIMAVIRSMGYTQEFVKK